MPVKFHDKKKQKQLKSFVSKPSPMPHKGRLKVDGAIRCNGMGRDYRQILEMKQA